MGLDKGSYESSQFESQKLLNKKLSEPLRSHKNMNLIIRQRQIFKSGKDWQLFGNNGGVMRHSPLENKQFRLQNSPPVGQPCVAQELGKKKMMTEDGNEPQQHRR